MPELSTRTANFTDSVIRRMTRISNQYGAVNLSQGFPDFEPPREILDRLAEVTREDFHQYSITWGAQNFREALAAKIQHFSGVQVDPNSELVVTCGSMHSRNRRAGMMLGEGKTLAYVQENMGMVVEGVNATRFTHEIAESLGVDMPITASIYNILYGGGTIQETVSALMSRTKKAE